MGLFSDIRTSRLSDTGARRFFVATAAAAWVGAIGAIIFFLIIGLMLARQQKPADVYKAIGDYNRAEFFAQNFLLVWLAGAPRDAEKLTKMASLPGQLTLNSDPFTVTAINAVDVSRTAAGKDTEWNFTLAVTLIPPSNGGNPTRLAYRVTTLERGSTFLGLTWPRPVNTTSTPLAVAPYYTKGLSLNSPLGKQVGLFLSAYYTQNDTGSLGRYVTSNFTDTAIAASPYTTVTPLDIKIADQDPDPANANPGDNIHAMVIAKASAAESTFNHISIPLRINLSPNRQWLIDGFEDPIHFGAVSDK